MPLRWLRDTAAPRESQNPSRELGAVALSAALPSGLAHESSYFRCAITSRFHASGELTLF